MSWSCCKPLKMEFLSGSSHLNGLIATVLETRMIFLRSRKPVFFSNYTSGAGFGIARVTLKRWWHKFIAYTNTWKRFVREKLSYSKYRFMYAQTTVQLRSSVSNREALISNFFIWIRIWSPIYLISMPLNFTLPRFIRTTFSKLNR